MAAANIETIQLNSAPDSETNSGQKSRVPALETDSNEILESSTKKYSRIDKTAQQERKPRTLKWFRRKREKKMSAKWMARHSGLSLRTVYNRLALISKGRKAASELRRPGRPASITEAHKREIYKILTQSGMNPNISASERNLQFRKDVKLITGRVYSSIHLYRLRRNLIEHPPSSENLDRAQL